MKFRCADTEFEGTIEEWRQIPELHALFGTASRQRSGEAPALFPVPVVSEETSSPTVASIELDPVREFVTSRAVGKGAELLIRWTNEVLGYGAEFFPGKSKSTPDGLNNYFRLCIPGPKRVAAFVYSRPGTNLTDFHLPDSERGEVAKTLRNDGYVSLYLDENNYEEALKLARKAMERSMS